MVVLDMIWSAIVKIGMNRRETRRANLFERSLQKDKSQQRHNGRREYSVYIYMELTIMVGLNVLSSSVITRRFRVLVLPPMRHTLATARTDAIRAAVRFIVLNLLSYYGSTLYPKRFAIMMK